MLAEQLTGDDLKLLAAGGAKRSFLLLPNGIVDHETVAQWKRNLGDEVMIAEIDGLKSALLCIDGEQIELSQLVHQLWLPNRDRSQLADRLHSRSDIEWLPLDN